MSAFTSAFQSHFFSWLLFSTLVQLCCLLWRAELEGKRWRQRFHWEARPQRLYLEFDPNESRSGNRCFEMWLPLVLFSVETGIAGKFSRKLHFWNLRMSSSTLSIPMTQMLLKQFVSENPNDWLKKSRIFTWHFESWAAQKYLLVFAPGVPGGEVGEGVSSELRPRTDGILKPWARRANES